jgi:hypothetical protein
VPKKTGGLRMCIDYTELNKHCTKDPFPLPHIDQVVDSKAGSVLLCFLDCYSGCHQIALHPDDEDKTTFITPHDIYCYKVMTFGLKNTGATYQKAIQKSLKSQIGKNVEAYIDDVVVKTTVAFEFTNFSAVSIHRVLDAVPLLVDLFDDDLGIAKI